MANRVRNAWKICGIHIQYGTIISAKVLKMYNLHISHTRIKTSPHNRFRQVLVIIGNLGSSPKV